MKRVLLILHCIVLSLLLPAQNNYSINFENPADYSRFVFNPLTNHNNLWQIGPPQKPVFSSAFSPVKTLVTDTVNSYPANDTSVVTLVHIAEMGWYAHHTVMLTGYYYVNSDTLTDYGKVEVSPDNGTTWIDLLNPGIYTNDIYLLTSPPVFSGNSGGWRNFSYDITGLGFTFNVQLMDTILYRFTFISDTAQTNKDGLMFDDLDFADYIEDIPEQEAGMAVAVLPNPAAEQIFIHPNGQQDKTMVQILNMTGQLVFSAADFDKGSIDVRQWPAGIYQVRCWSGDKYAVKKLVVNH